VTPGPAVVIDQPGKADPDGNVKPFVVPTTQTLTADQLGQDGTKVVEPQYLVTPKMDGESAGIELDSESSEEEEAEEKEKVIEEEEAVEKKKETTQVLKEKKPTQVLHEINEPEEEEEEEQEEADAGERFMALPTYFNNAQFLPQESPMAMLY